MEAEREVLPLGGFFLQDEDGYILNPCRPGLIASDCLPWLEAGMAWLQDRYRGSLHSLWLRGSLPRGLFRPGLSDIDLFALVNSPAAPDLASHPGAGWTTLSTPPALLKTPLDLAVHPWREPLAGRYPRLAMLLATQSLPLHGPDLRPALPRYRPGPDLMVHYRWLQADWQAFGQDKAYDPEAFRGMAKMLLRVGFELVMERTGRFTPDLYWCWQVFGEVYPERKAAMRQILEWYLRPPTESGPGVEKMGEMTAFLLTALRGEGYI